MAHAEVGRRKGSDMNEHGKPTNGTDASPDVDPSEDGAHLTVHPVGRPVIWFKLTYSLRDMHVSRPSDLPVQVTLNQKSRAVLWFRETPHQEQTARQLCCDIVVEREVPLHVAETLRAHLSGRLLLDTPAQVSLPYTVAGTIIVDTEGRIAPNSSIPFNIMPKMYQAFQRKVSSELSDLLTRFVATMRWRQGATGPHRPFGVVAEQWSSDAITWNPAFLDFQISRMSPRGLDVRPDMLLQVSSAMAARNGEPFSHELVREAAELARTAPRSALLIAMSALETGVKHYISHTSPLSEPLLEKIQSPPLVILLQEVIPSIHKHLNIKSNLIPLTDANKDYLKKWVTQRNQVAHGVKHSVNNIELRRFILFVRDLLYILDFHAGHGWALERITTSRFGGNDDEQESIISSV